MEGFYGRLNLCSSSASASARPRCGPVRLHRLCTSLHLALDIEVPHPVWRSNLIRWCAAAFPISTTLRSASLAVAMVLPFSIPAFFFSSSLVVSVTAAWAAVAWQLCSGPGPAPSGFPQRDGVDKGGTESFPPSVVMDYSAASGSGNPSARRLRGSVQIVQLFFKAFAHLHHIVVGLGVLSFAAFLRLLAALHPCGAHFSQTFLPAMIYHGQLLYSI